MRTTRAAFCLLGWLLTILTTLVIRAAPAAAAEPGAKALEGRLLAPCCWNGTLDTHDSELAHDLRHEIEDRIGKGETADAVETDLVHRYGDRMRALPHASALNGMLIAALVAFLGVGAFVLFRVRRWRSSEDVAPPDTPAAATAGAEANLNARIDAELAEID